MGVNDHEQLLSNDKPITTKTVIEAYPYIKNDKNGGDALQSLLLMCERLIITDQGSAAWMFRLQPKLLKEVLEHAKANKNTELVNHVRYSLRDYPATLAENSQTAAEVLPLIDMPILNPADINFNLNGHGERSKILGKGVSAVVLSAELKKKPVALKIDVLQQETTSCYQEAMTYTHIETHGGHPNITKFYGLAIPRILVLELCETTLGDVLANLKEKTSEEKAIYALRAIQQLASALMFLSAHKIIVADLEVKNILVREDGSLAICDLANSLFEYQLQDPFYRLQHLTTITAAPPEVIVLAQPENEREEAIKEYNITPGNSPSMDIYALGIIAISLYFATRFNMIPYYKADERREIDTHDPSAKAKDIATYYLDYVMQHHEHGWPRIKTSNSLVVHAFNRLARKMHQANPFDRINPEQAKDEADRILATHCNKRAR